MQGFPTEVLLIFTLLIWVLYGLIFLSSPKNKVNQWCFIAGFLLSVGVLKEYSYYGVEACLDHVQTGTFDGAILPQKFNAPELQFTLLWRDPACVVLPKYHPLAQNAAVSVFQIANEQLLVPQIYQAIYPPLFQSCAELGITFQNIVSTPSPLVAIHRCAQGQGVLLLDQQSLKNCIITSSDICILPVVEPLFIDLYCAYPRKHSSPAISTFIQNMQTSAQGQT